MTRTSMTRANAQTQASKQLAAADIDLAALEARILLCHVLQCRHEELLTNPKTPLASQQKTALQRLIARRCEGIPISRLIGQREFYGRDFKLTPHVFDPRPDSETLIDVAKTLITPKMRVLELGCGSGALLISLLHQDQSLTGLGVDISRRATQTSRLNAARLNTQNRARFLNIDWQRLKQKKYHARFDMIIANPPYIAHDEWIKLPQTIRKYDPPRALKAGRDGLDAYHEILRLAPHLLNAPQSPLIMEIGYQQASALKLLCKKYRFTPPEIYKDLAQNPRIIITYPQ